MAARNRATDVFVEALLEACSTGQVDQLQTLLEQIQDLDLDPISFPPTGYLLRTAAKNGQASIVRYLFSKHPDCRKRKPWEAGLPDGMCWNDMPAKWSVVDDYAVYAAIQGSDPINVFQVFLDFGISVDYHLDRGVSPLAIALFISFELASFLLQKGANPNGRYSSEESFLGSAARRTTPELLNLLLQHGARIQGSHALRQAAEYRRICNAERLLELGADINEVFTMSRESNEVLGSAFHAAINGGSLTEPVTDSPAEMVQFLLKHGAKPGILDRKGKTPLQVARRRKKQDIIALFEKHGMDI